MAMPRKTVAMMAAEAENARALALAVRLHEQEQAARDEFEMRRAMATRARGGLTPVAYDAPARARGPTGDYYGEPWATELGLAQPGPLHKQDMRQYDPAYTDVSSAPALTPAQQEALDAQHDYLADWTFVDEAGNRRLRRQPTSQQLDISPPSAEGQRLTQAANDADVAAMQAEADARAARRTKPLRRTI